jgi:hypothetical protein
VEIADEVDGRCRNEIEADDRLGAADERRADVEDDRGGS